MAGVGAQGDPGAHRVLVASCHPPFTVLLKHGGHTSVLLSLTTSQTTCPVQRLTEQTHPVSWGHAFCSGIFIARPAACSPEHPPPGSKCLPRKPQRGPKARGPALSFRAAGLPGWGEPHRRSASVCRAQPCRNVTFLREGHVKT